MICHCSYLQNMCVHDIRDLIEHPQTWWLQTNSEAGNIGCKMQIPYLNLQWTKWYTVGNHMLLCTAFSILLNSMVVFRSTLEGRHIVNGSVTAKRVRTSQWQGCYWLAKRNFQKYIRTCSTDVWVHIWIFVFPMSNYRSWHQNKMLTYNKQQPFNNDMVENITVID